jgi:hypothetical protein
MKITYTFMLSLALIPGAAACNGADFEEATEATEAIEVAADELETVGLCPEPQKLEPGVFSTDADEGRLVFSTDGNSAYFHRVNDGGVLTIMESHNGPGGWSAPIPAAFSSGYDELDPFVTEDDQTLYYASYRPVAGPTPRGDADLWKVVRTVAGWSAPIHLGPRVNSESMELFPSTSRDGALYFNSDRPGGAGAWDIYRAAPAWWGFHQATPLPGEVNTAIWEFNPSPSPGGRVLAFASLDPDPAAPFSDVFYSRRQYGQFSARIDAGPCVNTEAPEYHPTLDWPRRRLVFVRFDPVTGGDFYEVKLPKTKTFSDVGL